VPSVHPECYFPAEQRGRWLLFDRGRHEEVVVDPGHVTFGSRDLLAAGQLHLQEQALAQGPVQDVVGLRQRMVGNAVRCLARIPRRRHPREDRRENVSVSFSLPRE